MLRSTYCKVNLRLIVGDWTNGVLFMWLCHVLKCRIHFQVTFEWLLGSGKERLFICRSMRSDIFTMYIFRIHYIPIGGILHILTYLGTCYILAYQIRHGVMWLTRLIIQSCFNHASLEHLYDLTTYKTLSKMFWCRKYYHSIAKYYNIQYCYDLAIKGGLVRRRIIYSHIRLATSKRKSFQ